LLAETFEIAESVLVNEADQPEKFEQGILQWGGCEQEDTLLGERLLEGVGDHVRGLVNISQPVGFINHHEIPWRRMDIGRLIARELVGANDNVVTGLERLELSLPDCRIVRFGFENLAWQKKLFAQLLMPLFAQIRRCNHQDAALSLRPFLRNHQPGFDGFAQADFVSEERSFGKRGVECEKRRVHLMRIQIDLSAGHGTGELFDAVGRAAFGQLVCEIFGVVVGQGHV
jgi:hypothetical protein